MSVTVYTMPNCQYCKNTKGLLQAKNIPFKEVDVFEDPEGMAKVKELGYQTMPVVVTEDDHWCGMNMAKIAKIKVGE